MQDYEVGELWEHYGVHYNQSEHKGKQIRALIRKLVEERREHFDEAIETTLKGFGIDPKTWK